MKNTFNQSATPLSAAEALLQQWGMDYLVEPDGTIAIERDFRRDGKRASTYKSAEELAEKMFGSRDALIVLHMAQYTQKHEIMKIIGVPLGFAGADDDSGTLTRRLREHPCALLVLDEVEKGHPEIVKMLKEAVAKKEIMDNKGQRVSLANVTMLTIMSSPSQEMLAARQTKMGLELAIRATEGIQNPVQVFKPLRFKGAGLTMFRA
ncbi:MAG: ATP-dependent Clp protease ATP-binding subunit [Alphaproteobacteria bacterium]|nr:MAG: ATP-dependent Clp protease ATP-binding subunit [Alphaproteobacteria bacterium]